MAELYLKQGQPARALSIYRRVARQRPNDATVAQRLAELEAELTGNRGGAMSFREHMERIVNETPGAIAGVVMGFDGIPIDSFEVGTPEVDTTTLLTEYAAATQVARRVKENLPESGDVHEVSITSGKSTAMFRLLTDEYFLAVIVGAGGLTGKARYLMRVTAPKLIKELS